MKRTTVNFTLPVTVYHEDDADPEVVADDLAVALWNTLKRGVGDDYLNEEAQMKSEDIVEVSAYDGPYADINPDLEATEVEEDLAETIRTRN